MALERPPFTEQGVLLGSGGLILFDERACALDLALYFSEFCEDESCGRCTTCHGGSQRLVEILRRISHGGGRESDLDQIGILDRSLQNANCLHGQFTPYAVRSVIRHFGDEIMEHIRSRRCRAGVCRGLIRHRISDPQAAELEEAAELCPTSAIVESTIVAQDAVDQAKGRTIDVAACIQCGLCLEVAPDAVVVEPRFDGSPSADAGQGDVAQGDTGQGDIAIGIERAPAGVVGR
jgi:ferredoxin